MVKLTERHRHLRWGTPTASRSRVPFPLLPVRVSSEYAGTYDVYLLAPPPDAVGWRAARLADPLHPCRRRL